MQELLKNQVAIVTGGERGIGRSIVEKFLAAGASVAVFGIDETLGKELNGDNCRFFPVDVSDGAAVDTAVKQVIEAHGKVDILVNNAGITRDTLLMRMKEEEWDAVLNVNLKSCFNTCQAVIRPMIKARGGSIINMSSVVGLIGNAGQTNYAASKAGMIGFAKALAREVAGRGIRVNCIAPGFIETPMTDKLSETQKESILAMIPKGKMGQPKDIANAALFLASPLAEYITGQTLAVDGGFVM